MNKYLQKFENGEIGINARTETEWFLLLELLRKEGYSWVGSEGVWFRFNNKTVIARTNKDDKTIYDQHHSYFEFRDIPVIGVKKLLKPSRTVKEIVLQVIKTIFRGLPKTLFTLFVIFSLLFSVPMLVFLMSNYAVQTIVAAVISLILFMSYVNGL